MITVAYISYRMAGRPERSATYGVRAKTEAEAFEQAVEHLKVDLIMMAAGNADPIAGRAKVYEILRLRPWANGYTHALPPTPEPKPLGNVEAQEGCDRCTCGCKYWENDHCIDCGKHVSKAVNRMVGTRCECGAPYDPEFGGFACAK